MAKHPKYSEVKHPDRFYDALAAVWQKVEGYAWPLVLALGTVLVVVLVWMVVARRYSAHADRPWTEYFKLQDSVASATEEDVEKRVDKLLESASDLASKYQGRPVAAIALIEVARGHSSMATRLRTEDPKAAKAHFEEAAQAAERFVADFPTHPLFAIAQYEAGKARLELGQHEKAANHFEEAGRTPIAFLAALAKLDAARCYEKLGQLDKARRNYEAVRDNRMGAWCSEQAEYQLSRLNWQPPKGS